MDVKRDLTWKDKMPCGLCRFRYDEDFSVIETNAYYQKVFNRAVSLRQILVPEEFIRFSSEIQKQRKNGMDTLEIEAACLTKEKEFLYALFSIALEEDGLSCAFFDITERKNKEERLIKSEEEYRLTLKNHTDRSIIQYDIQERVLTQSDYSCRLLAMPKVMYQVPESILEEGYLAKESEADFLAFFHAIICGEKNGSCVIRMKNFNGKFFWSRCDFTTIFKKDKPIRAIISYEDVTEQREKELAYKKWKQHNETQLQSSIAYYEFNLTKNRFDQIDGPLAARLPLEVRGSYVQVVEYSAEQFVYSEDKEPYLNMFSRQSFLDHYYAGNRELKFEHRRVSRSQKVFWACAEIQLLPDPYSNDIKGFVLIQDIDLQKKEEQKLLKQLKTDSLTGLLNRSAAVESIFNILQESEGNYIHAFVIVDVDHFKQLNDTMGHQFGDEVLNKIALNLRSVLRSDDIVARLGGDEFILFMKNVSSREIFEKKISFLNSILYQSFPSDLVVSGSIGVSLYPKDGTTFEELYQSADIALYQAKRNGRNRHVFFQDFMNQEEWSPHRTTPIDPLTEQENRTGSSYYSYEDRYHVVLEQTRTIVVEWDSEKKSYYASPFTSQLFLSQKLDTLQSKYFITQEDVHPDDWHLVEQLVKETKSGKNRIEMTLRFKKMDETYVWCRLVMTLRRFGNQISWMLVTINDVNDAVLSQKALEYHAEYDEVTGCLNYTKFRKDVEMILQNREHYNYSLWYCDIRNFKLINDIYGYDVGDDLLRYWAKVIAGDIREGERFCRISADHFSALRRYEDRKELSIRFYNIAQKLLEFKGFSEKAYRVELVAGVYCIETEEDILKIDEMINRANIAQKSVKPLGGSRFALYTETMRNQMIWDQEIEVRMHAALQQKEFCLFLQPQIRIQGEKRMIGAEALVRWKNPDSSLISPSEFIPLFEKNGFIVQLDQFVFEETCNYLRNRIDYGKPTLKISVNVSRISLLQSDFIERYVEIKQRFQIPNGLLELECTESVFADNIKRLNKIVQIMHQYGFLFSIDDFGSGYSSLNMLKDIEVDVLKLDMMFFRNGLSEKRDRAIVSSIITMAKTLGMVIVAEGVEEKEQLEALETYGCDIVQGYYFGPPVSAMEFERRYPI